jgi:hypothetical protein
MNAHLLCCRCASAPLVRTQYAPVRFSRALHLAIPERAEKVDYRTGA